MRKFFFLLALGFACTFVMAQETTPASVSKDAAAAATDDADGPGIDFDTKQIDYGSIDQGSNGVRIFNFTNTGTEPLVIKHAKGSCGCTVPTYPKEPIMPGEANKIEVKYDTKRVGPFTKRVTLTTNASADPIVLTIKGKVNAKPTQEGVPASKPNVISGGK